MKVFINRFDPDSGRQWVQEYECDIGGHSYTVMDVLQKISDEQAPTLGYFRHSICNHGICGRCTMKINEKVGLACTVLASEHESLYLRPAPNSPVVRDLVVDTSRR